MRDAHPRHVTQRQDRRAASTRRIAHAALVALALAAGTVLAQPLPSQALDQLAAKAASQGSARVIVGLNLPSKPEGQLSPRSAAQQRAHIRAAQNSAVAQLLGGGGGQVSALFDAMPHLAAEVDANALARLRQSPLVATIEEDVAVPPGLLQSTALIKATVPWGVGRTGTGWSVAVLDTGVDKSHPFLAGKVVSEACYSTTSGSSNSLCPGGASSSVAAGSGRNCTAGIGGCDHGTHVAGIVAGSGAPDGSSGVAPGASLIAIQVFSHFPASNNVMSYTSDQIKALERVLALKDTYSIAAVNMSLGGGQYFATCDASQSAIKAAIDNLRSVGIATVIASGNNGWRDSMSAPACVSTAISVGSHCDAGDGGTCATGIGGVASYSNIAPWISLVAPGSFITSSVPGTGYSSFNGTSMAAPHVAGAWALLRQAHPTLSVTDGLSMLRANAIAINDTRSGASVADMRRIDLGFLTSSGHALTVTRSGTGSGSVSSAPTGIDCGSDCAETFSPGTTVTLSASAAIGSSFTGWSGACSGTGACTVSMTQVRSVNAGFTAPPYTLTLVRSGNGAGTVASTPAGLSCSAGCSVSFGGGTVVTLVPTAAAGSRFAGWSGACSGSGSCTVTMSQARSVTASFAKLSYALGVGKAGTGSGTVTSSPSGLSCGGTCSVTRLHGSVVTLTATPASDSAFTGWSGVCSGTGKCTLTVSAAVDAVATFTRTRVPLTYTKTGNGAGRVVSSPAGLSCSGSCKPTVSVGTPLTLSAQPATGSTFVGWSGACTGTGTCQLPMAAATAVSAHFIRTTHLVTLVREGSGAGAVTSSPSGINCGSVCSAAFNAGVSVTLTAKPAADSVFSGWSGACSGTATTCKLLASQAHTVRANFTLVKAALTVTRTGTGSGSVRSTPTGINCSTTCSAMMPLGSVVSLQPTPMAESSFTGWGGACSGTGPCVVTMSAARSVTAQFTRTHYTLTTTVAGSTGGRIVSAPSGIDCGSSCKTSLPLDTQLTLDPQPAAGWAFTGWGGACSGSGACVVTLSSVSSVTATFVRITHLLTVGKSGAGSGTVSSVPSGVSCGSTCTRSYNQGATVTLSAAPTSTSIFGGWSGACSGTGSCTLTMDGAKNVTATFTPK